MPRPPRYPLLPDDPQQFLRQDEFVTFVVDSDGILMNRYASSDGELRSNPVTIALYALINANAYHERGEARFKETFARHVRWLLDTFDQRDTWGAWYYEFDFSSPGAHCQAPWPSAMAQGAGISALIRYHLLFDDPDALEVAEKALGAFRVPIAEGGVLRVDDDGAVWLEEYPCPQSGTALNGFVIALIGAKEFSDYTGSVEGLEVFREGMRTLEARLGDFELRLPLMRWTRYDNRYIVHAGKYHHIHVRQLRWLMDMAEGASADFVRAYHARWRRWEEIYGTSLLFRPYALLCQAYTALCTALKGSPR